MLPWVNPDTTTIATLTKVLFDQLVSAPIFYTFLFIVMPKMEGKSNKEAIENVKEKVWPTTVTNWKIWPLVQFINFYFIPVRFQLSFANVIALFWNAYMSWMVNNSKLFKCVILRVYSPKAKVKSNSKIKIG